MTAALSIDHIGPDSEAGTSASAQPVRQKKLTFGEFQARAMPATILLVFAFIAGGMYLYRGDLAGSVGLGLFMAFWLGGGFGFLIGGVLYGLQVEASHD